MRNVPGQPRELRSGFLSMTTIEADAQYNGLYVYHVTPDVDAVIRIPMLGHKRSLNVATAAGVVLYELLRRRLHA